MLEFREGNFAALSFNIELQYKKSSRFEKYYGKIDVFYLNLSSSASSSRKSVLKGSFVNLCQETRQSLKITAENHSHNALLAYLEITFKNVIVDRLGWWGIWEIHRDEK